MTDRFIVLADSQRRRQILEAVPDEFKELVAVSGALLAESTEYVCPSCEERVLLENEVSHKGICKKRPAGLVR